MVERKHQGGFFSGEEVKRKAAAKHLTVYNNSEYWDEGLLDRRIAIQILARDTKIPLIKTTLEMIDDTYNIR